ncbi:conserved hypothetical protein [uncultured Paludibacter sp.]|uniref:Uncharacterized protein n=1 Tax=uncultured Paludibacter sp. TaxID=497635 RepID=A0A653AGI8_9BACT|nr:conserved hypothetical protein [uncultured Paludibacter sp.]
MNYPLNLTFRITTISNDFTIQDANGENLAFVRQKLLKLKEQVDVYKDPSRDELKYKIKANKWLDFSASYLFFDEKDKELGRVVRRGWKSLWKAHYEIYDENDVQEFLISEENPWVKVLDSTVGEIPIVGMFTGYWFHPSYAVVRPDGTVVAQLKKVKSFFGRRFVINKLGEFDSAEENRIILSLMMMILLERQRG